MAPRNQTQRNQRIPTLRTVQTSRIIHRRSQSRATQPSGRQEPRRQSNPSQGNRYFGCGICKADHRIASCKRFLDLNLARKYKTVLKMHYCTNCLARNHLLADCTNTARCRVCQSKHHTILHGHKKVLGHIRTEQTSTTTRTSPTRTSTALSKNTVFGVPAAITRTFVPTAEVYVMTEDGCISVRAILNPSLTSSRIAASFVRDIKLKPFKLDGTSYVKLTITPNMTSLIKYNMCWSVVKDLPKQPYTHPFRESVKEKVGNVALADPKFYSNEPILMEIGGNLYTTVLKTNLIHLDGGSFLAQDSTLGWLVMGSLSG